MQRLHKIGKRFFTRMMLPSVFMMLASFSVPAMADDVYHLLVKMKNDEEKAFMLMEKPVVSFNDTECVIDYQGYTGYFDMGDIKDVTIVSRPAGVDEISSDMVTLDYTDPSSVVVRGVTAGAVITLHTINGILIDSVYADSEGNARINMSAVSPATVCIISINSSKNFKIYKK